MTESKTVTAIKVIAVGGFALSLGTAGVITWALIRLVLRFT